MKANPPKHTLALLALFITSAIWGISGPIIKYTLKFVSPFTFLFFRFLIASFCIFPFFTRKIRRGIKWKDFPKLLALSFLGQTLTLSLIFLGFERTTALEGSLISALAPIFIIFGGALFLKEKITRQEKLGLGLTLLGTLFLIGEPLLEQGFAARKHLLGNFLVFSSNITWAVFTLWSKELFLKYRPLALTAFSFIFALFTFFPLMLFEQPSITTFRLPAVLGILYMGLLGSTVAFFTYTFGLSKIEASEATVFTYLQPLFAAPLAILLLSEKIAPLFLVGAGVVAVGVFLSEYKGRTVV